MESELKKILGSNKCIFDRYMTKVEYIKSKDDIHEILYLTSVITTKKKKILFITREISGNWFDSVKDIEDILFYISKHFNYSNKEYRFILHIYIESIKFEHFYLIDAASDKKLLKINSDELKKLLS